MRSLTHHDLSSGTAWMTGGLALTAAFQAVYFIIVARALGAGGFGAFAAAVAMAAIVVPFAGLGARNLVVMRTSRDYRLFGEYFGTGVGAVLLTGAVLALGTLAVGYAVFHGTEVARALPWVVASDIGAAQITDLVTHCYQAHQRALAAAIVLAANSAALALAAILFVASNSQPSASTWAIWYFGANTVVAVVALVLVTVQLGHPRLGWGAARTILRHGIFYSVGSASQTVYGDIDKAMLASMDNTTVAGFYTGAYRAVQMMSIPILAFVWAANPRFFREGERNPHAVWQLAQSARKVAVAYGAFAALLCLAAAPLLPRILGPSYEQSTDVLRWLSLLPLIQAIHLIYGNALMGVGRQALRSALSGRHRSPQCGPQRLAHSVVLMARRCRCHSLRRGFPCCGDGANTAWINSCSYCH